MTYSDIISYYGYYYLSIDIVKTMCQQRSKEDYNPKIKTDNPYYIAIKSSKQIVSIIKIVENKNFVMN